MEPPWVSSRSLDVVLAPAVETMNSLPGDRVMLCGMVAEKLGRRWLAIEMEEEYVRASKFRFEDVD